ncbi:uncharacterized protein BKCO1_230008 [Diplodia corticola]|uniref:Uncharacterized protein n=1 Tax=Diplodia corticola TaxID=236234 RepID=A0A1J9S4B0_9PEZI|nr:uncharacterized protein BKCO1_230008 [Diplodia corticola]OJD34469.1 hypothetical protein BKCO1_230008 [Diplodia corticola]
MASPLDARAPRTPRTPPPPPATFSDTAEGPAEGPNSQVPLGNGADCRNTKRADLPPSRQRGSQPTLKHPQDSPAPGPSGFTSGNEGPAGDASDRPGPGRAGLLEQDRGG